MDGFKNTSFALFFRKFPRLFAAGLIFSAFAALFMSLSVFAGTATGFSNSIIYCLGLIPSCFFLPGLIAVVKKYLVEKSFVPVVNTFFTAVKENFRQFIPHGFVIYFVVSCSAFAMIYYSMGAKMNYAYNVVLIAYAIVALVLITAVFYLPLITVTYELRLRDIYKNSFMLVLGALPRNLAALAYAAALSFSALFLYRSAGGAARYTALGFIAALYPLLLCCGVIPLISKGMTDNLGEIKSSDPKPKPVITEEEKETVINMNSNGDYVFVNGKMIKNPNKEANDERSI